MYCRKLISLAGLMFFCLFPYALAANDCEEFSSQVGFPVATNFLEPFFSEQSVQSELVVDCGSTWQSLTIVDAQDDTMTAISNRGYLRTAEAWSPLEYIGTNTIGSWNLGFAISELPENVQLDSSTTFHLSYSCSFEKAKQYWRCGCEDGLCIQPKWSLQFFHYTEVENNNPPATGLLEQIKLPPGFGIHYFAENVTNARSLARGDNGTIFVGNRDGGSVYALVDSDNDLVADQKFTIASGMWQPNGVEFVDSDLYVAEVNRILRYPDIEADLTNPPEPEVIYDGLPTDRSHGWKYLAKGPDDRLYLGIGAPCNVCERDDERYATIASIELDGSDFQIFASGIRNTVGFDWHPETDVLWFTDNGRDRMGDDIPADELNAAWAPNLHFGFPYCHQGDIWDDNFDDQASCAEFTPPKIKLGPHVAALGMKFYTGEMFPTQFQGDIFIAEHGSWNRTNKIGYQVSRVNIVEGLDNFREENF